MKRLAALLAFLLLSTAQIQADDETKVSVVSYGFLDTEQAVEQAKLFLSPNGKVAANTRNNTLIIVDSPAVAQKIEAHFRDMPPLQNVHIEVQVLEGNERTRQVLGIPLQRASSVDRRSIQLTVMDGGHASILVGERVPRPEFFFQFFLSHGYIVEGTTFDEVGSRLDVQPRISGNQVLITLTPTISFFTGRHKKTIAVRELSTQVMATNGQTIEIGGGPSSSEFDALFYSDQHNRSLRFLLTPRW